MRTPQRYATMLDSLDTDSCRELLAACPLGLLLIGADGRVEWMNDTLREWLGDAASVIQGHGAETAPEGLAALWDDEATVTIPPHGEQRDPRWLLGHTHRLADGRRFQYFSDATPMKQLLQERDDLLAELDELTVTDADTGMPNRRALSAQLATEVARSRRYGNPLSTVIMRLDRLEGSAEAIRQVLISIRNLLNEQRRWADTIGRLDDNEFLFILPETGLDAARHVAAMTAERLQKLMQEDDTIQVEARFGVSEWQKGDDIGLMMQRAREDLEASS